MHIHFDLSPVVHRKAGLATYARQLANELVRNDTRNSYSAFYYGREIVEPLRAPLDTLPIKNVAWNARRWRMTVALRTLMRLPMDSRILPRTSEPTIFHATEHLLPPLNGARSVFTFHDAIYALFPQYHLRMNLLYLGQMMPRFLRRADHIIAVSECSKRDAMRLYGVPEQKISVIYEGVDASFAPVTDAVELQRVRQKYNLPQRFILYLGTIEPRKNLPTLFAAYRQLRDAGVCAAGELVVAGRKGWLYESTFNAARALRLEGDIRFTDYIAREDMNALLSAARVFAFPSIYEGFGLPPLEAMACGAPVVCSNTSSLPEVVGDAALTVDPMDVGALAHAIQHALTDDSAYQTLRAKGHARAAQFTWRKAAAQTARVYAQVRAHDATPAQ